MATKRASREMQVKAISRWSQERRLEFIDFRLTWDGRLNRADLMSFFGISVPQASTDIARYRELAPENLRYDGSARTYVASSTFRPVFVRTSPERFMADLLAEVGGAGVSETNFAGWRPEVGQMPVPSRSMNQQVVFALLRAIRDGQAVQVLYQSIQRAEPRQRTISPHALGHDGFRWHVRAFCHIRNDYRDFVLARVLDVATCQEEWRDGSQDSAWHQLLLLVLSPNPELSPAARRVIELDYGMTDGRVTLECRQALAFYALRHLGLSEEIGGKPHAQQIVLSNRNEVNRLIAGLSTAD